MYRLAGVVVQVHGAEMHTHVCVHIYIYACILFQILFPYRLLQILGVVPLPSSRSLLVICFTYFWLLF